MKGLRPSIVFLFAMWCALLAQAPPPPARTPGRQIDPCPQFTASNMFVVKLAGSHELGCAAFPIGVSLSPLVNGVATLILPMVNGPVFGSFYPLNATTPNSFPISGPSPVNPTHLLIFRNGQQLIPSAYSVNAVPLTVSPSGFAAVLTEPPNADDQGLAIQAWQ